MESINLSPPQQMATTVEYATSRIFTYNIVSATEWSPKGEGEMQIPRAVQRQTVSTRRFRGTLVCQGRACKPLAVLLDRGVLGKLIASRSCRAKKRFKERYHEYQRTYQ